MHFLNKVRRKTAISSPNRPKYAVIERNRRSKWSHEHSVGNGLHGKWISHGHAKSRRNKLSNIRSGRGFDYNVWPQSLRFEGCIDLPAHGASWRKADERFVFQIFGTEFLLFSKPMSNWQYHHRWRTIQGLYKHRWMFQTADYKRYIQPAQ